MLPSFVLHIAVVVLLMLLAPSPLNVIRIQRSEKPRRPILLRPTPSPLKGGGGATDALPPSPGRLPRFALRQFAPPVATPVNVAEARG
jgi:hypothetical protein